MKAMQRNFSILGATLTIIIVVGLIMQYGYLNEIISNEKQKNIIHTREHLADDVNSRISEYSQFVNIMAEFIGTGQWEEVEIEEFMTSLVANNKLINIMYFGDTNNKLINSKNMTPPDDYVVEDRPWYKAAVAEGGLIISDAYASVRDGSTVVSISKPVYDKEHDFIGVASLDIEIDEIIKIVEEAKVQGAGFSFLIDGVGNVLAHPNYTNTLKSKLISIDSLSEGVHEEILNTETGQIKVRLDGVEGYLTYRPIENTHWTIGNFISLREFKGNNGELWRIFFIGIAIAVIIFISFTSIQKRSLLMPLLILDQDIKNINLENDITYRIPNKIKDPFYDIKNTLNRTLHKTQQLFEQVEADKKEILVQNNELNFLSYNDQLTGLYNRRSFQEQLKMLDGRMNLPITLVMGDANGLKLINDSFGHSAGDEFLINIAKVMTQASRDQDIVFRISGDEFVMILPKTNEEQAELVIERIKTLSKKIRVANDNFSDIEISVSYGFGTKHTMKTDILDVLKEAEDKMYTNKLFEGPNMRKRAIKTILQEISKDNQYNVSNSEGVSMACMDLGAALGMKQEELQELVNIGQVHDIGEIAISKSILRKKGRLTAEEWLEVKKHPEIGYRILCTVSEMVHLAEYTLAHHERYDGTGYPKGLKGEEIPLQSRIVAIADAYDAMSSDRPYRKALSKEEIILEFEKNAGTQFDPELTKIFVERIL